MDVRIPDVRFSDIFNIVRFLNCPVFGWSSDNRTNLSGFQTSGSNALYEPDVRYSDNCPDFRRFGTKTGTKTGLEPTSRPKPVPNRFRTGSEPVLVKRTKTSENRTSGSYKALEPDVRKPDITSGFQTLSESRTDHKPDAFRKRRNPDVRISDVYCIRTSSNFGHQVFRHLL